MNVMKKTNEKARHEELQGHTKAGRGSPNVEVQENRVEEKGDEEIKESMKKHDVRSCRNTLMPGEVRPM